MRSEIQTKLQEEKSRILIEQDWEIEEYEWTLRWELIGDLEETLKK